ncbi:MAG TPA: hypothetical protein PKA82_06305 [Pyrinomonadaceae bacterium]|nr:hypothetical protein [Pyrinomonadaceae bacterium]
MISGFNTDISYDGVVYHVQTEDKGLSSKLIVSLVYDRGTILASKRAQYDDLVAAGFDEKELSERLNRQHKLMCAAVKAGRIEDLMKMSSKAAPAKPAAEKVVPAEVPAPKLPTVASPIEPIPQTASPITLGRIETTKVISVVPPPVAAPPPAVEVPNDVFEDLVIIDDVDIVEDVFELEPEAVAVVSELSGIERPSNEKLGIELLGDSKFKGGDRKTVQIMVCRGTARKVVPNAQIMIKVLGSSFRPVIFHAKTDANGLANVHLQLPQFRAGRAALLVRAMIDGDEIELRRVVTPG